MLLPRCRRVFKKRCPSLILTAVPPLMQCVLLATVLTSHGSKRAPSLLFMTRFVATDQHLNQAHVCSRYFARAMIAQGLQNQSNPSFTTIFMILLAICCLARTWRNP